MPDSLVSSAGDVLYKPLCKHVDLCGLALVIHPLVPSCFFNAMVEGRLIENHGSSRLGEHGCVGRAADGGYHSYAKRLELDAHCFGHACKCRLGTCEDTCKVSMSAEVSDNQACSPSPAAVWGTHLPTPCSKHHQWNSGLERYPWLL